MQIKGVLWHSTGANNPNIKRYVQPSDNDVNRAKLLEIIVNSIIMLIFIFMVNLSIFVWIIYYFFN